MRDAGWRASNTLHGNGSLRQPPRCGSRVPRPAPRVPDRAYSVLCTASMILEPKYLPKLAATVGLFTRYGLADFAKQQGLKGIAPDPESGEADGAPSADKAAAFRKRLVELGPAYIKLGQVLSTRPDLLP